MCQVVNCMVLKKVMTLFVSRCPRICFGIQWQMNTVLTCFQLFLTENKNFTLENTQCEIIRVTYKYLQNHSPWFYHPNKLESSCRCKILFSNKWLWAAISQCWFFSLWGKKNYFSSNSKNGFCNMGYTTTLTHASAKWSKMERSAE
jgi:hypothetical protein